MSKDQPNPKRVLSGVQPSGAPHLGNYFGAMRQFVTMQANASQCYFMIADYHALNSTQDSNEMAKNILDVAINYIAIGLDPKKSIIFQQSMVPAHTELAWVFDTITTMPYLMRGHAYKDAEAKGKEVSVGKFNYPMLMAADILLYDVDSVPVGQDQKQHIEFTRDTAVKFNNIFGETFRLPDALIMDDVAIVPGIDGRKMSKSYGNGIPLFASDSEIDRLVASIVTDSGSGVPTNVRAIHELFRSKEELDKIYEENKGKYKTLKDLLAQDIKAFVGPMRTRRDEIAKNPGQVMDIIKQGSALANEQAEKVMAIVRKRIGIRI